MARLKEKMYAPPTRLWKAMRHDLVTLKKD
jgi:hypothetical protein